MMFILEKFDSNEDEQYLFFWTIEWIKTICFTFAKENKIRWWYYVFSIPMDT